LPDPTVIRFSTPSMGCFGASGGCGVFMTISLDDR
jgi:hypothetical protein